MPVNDKRGVCLKTWSVQAERSLNRRDDFVRNPVIDWGWNLNLVLERVVRLEVMYNRMHAR